MSNDYLKYRRELKLKGGKPAGVVREEKAQKAKFFKEQISQAPKQCENCGKPLDPGKVMIESSIVAHILPKAYFPSVATHPLNRLFLDDCHHNWDNATVKEAREMKCFPLAVERLKQFIDLVTEKRGIPKRYNGYIDR